MRRTGRRRAAHARAGKRIAAADSVGVYPIILALRGRRVVVVGGGAVAERKVRGLRESGARITLISPTADRRAARLGERRASSLGAASLRLRRCRRRDAGVRRHRRRRVNAAVVVDARKHGVLVNAASDAAHGDFLTPAVHRAGALTVTVDSAGLSPSFTRRIRDELALQFDARFARAAATLGALRERVLAVVPPEQRADVMRHFAERDIDDLAAMPPGAIEHEVERAVDTLARRRPSEHRRRWSRVARQRRSRCGKRAR